MNKFWFVFLFSISAFSICHAQKVTFYSDIAPIISKNCATCHHSGGYAPFSLTTYQDVAKRAAFIQYVTANRIMPPWKAEANVHGFANERTLAETEIALISQWVREGCKEGRKIKRDEPVYKSGTQLASVADLVLKMPVPLSLEAGGKQTYACYKIPYELERDTFVRAIEFVPQNNTLVHHASYQVLAVSEEVEVMAAPYYFMYGDSIKSVDDAHDYGYFNLIGNDGALPREVFHSGWLPGTSPLVFPEGVGFRLPRKGVIMIRNLHLSPTPVSKQETSSFHFHFSKKPIDRPVQFAAFRSSQVRQVIEPDSVKKFNIIIRLNSDMSLLAINPHMHLLGRSFKAYAITPARDTLPLIHVPDWDFNWQEFYRYKRILKIPKGSILKAEAVFDNTASNPFNPNSPPKDILFETGSMEDTEEMMRLVFLFLPYQEGDEQMSLQAALK